MMDNKLETSNSLSNGNGIPLRTINFGLPDDTKAYSKTSHTTIRCHPTGHHLGEDLGDTSGNHTNFYHWMHKNNGDKIVLKKLDECVTSNGKDVEDGSFELKVNFSNLESKSQTCDVVKDIISIKEVESTRVLLHPVILSYIDIRWNKMRRYIYTNFTLYILFLLSYSWFLTNIFYRKLHEDPILSKLFDPKGIDTSSQSPLNHAHSQHFLPNKLAASANLIRNLETSDDFLQAFPFENYTIAVFKNSEAINRNVSKHAATFSRCFGESVADQNACAGEAILSIFLLCMIIVLILKIWSMGPYSDFNYVRRLFNLELFVEIVVRTLALSCLALQYNMYYLKFCAAFGIFFAFIESIFRVGRLPCNNANLSSIMFYNISRKILKNLINLTILIMGCSFGFFILQKDAPNDHFENPLKAIIKTMIMALGEFDLGEMLEGKLNSTYDETTLYLNMLMVALLAVLGCLVMVNVIVAIIVSDIKELRKDVKIQDTLNKAYHVVSYGKILNLRPTIQDISKSSVIKRMTGASDRPIDICTHSICFKCDKVKVSPDCEEDLLNIVKKQK